MEIPEDPDETMYCLFQMKKALEDDMLQACDVLISNGVDIRISHSPYQLIGCNGREVPRPLLFGFCAVTRKTVQRDVVQCLMKDTRLQVAISNVRGELCQCLAADYCANRYRVASLLTRNLNRPRFVGMDTVQITPPASPDSCELQDVTPHEKLQANALREKLVPKPPPIYKNRPWLVSNGDPYHAGTAIRMNKKYIPVRQDMSQRNPAQPPRMYNGTLVNRSRMPVVPPIVRRNPAQLQQGQQETRVQTNTQTQPPRMYNVVVAPSVVLAASSVVKNPEQLERERCQILPILPQSKVPQAHYNLYEALKRVQTLRQSQKNVPVAPQNKIAQAHQNLDEALQRAKSKETLESPMTPNQQSAPVRQNYVQEAGGGVIPSTLRRRKRAAPSAAESPGSTAASATDVLQGHHPAKSPLPVETIIILPESTNTTNTEPSVANANTSPKRAKMSPVASTSQSSHSGSSSVTQATVQPVLSSEVSTIEPFGESDSTAAPSSSGTLPTPMPTEETRVSTRNRGRTKNSSPPSPEAQEFTELTPSGRPKRACTMKKPVVVAEAPKKAKEDDRIRAKEEGRPVDGYHFLDYRTYFWKPYDPIKHKAKRIPTKMDIVNFEIEVCKVCNTYVPGRMKLLHARSHGYQKRYRCAVEGCNFQTEQHDKGRDHVKNGHLDELWTHVHDWSRDMSFREYGRMMLRQCFPKSPIQRRPLVGHRHHMPFKHQGLEEEYWDIQEDPKNAETDPLDYQDSSDEEEDPQNSEIDPPEQQHVSWDKQKDPQYSDIEYQDVSGASFILEMEVEQEYRRRGYILDSNNSVLISQINI